ncbi:GPI-anchored surface protein, putative, partial [Bodo saltans]
MDGGTLLLLFFVSGLYWIAVESETVGCDVATLTLGSNRTYTFADCHNWDNGSGISVPVLIVAQSLVNVTVSVVRCSSLPFFRVLEGFSCTVPPDVPYGIGGLNVTVQDVTMDSTKPMISSQSSGVLATRWTVPACVPTVFILMRDSVLFIDGSGVTPANQPTYVPSPFLHVEVSNIHVGLVMQNVSITAYTNFAQSLVTFSCLNAVVLSSSVYVSMHNVSIDMVGRALNYSQLPVITVRENHILQTVLEFETTLIALANISIFMSGDCSFRVHFGLDTLNTSLLSSDALSASYYAFVVHAQSQSSSRGITLRNFSLVLSEKGSYYSEVQGSQFASMLMVKELEGLTDALIVLRNLVVHHTVTQFINIHVDTLVSRYGSVVHVTCWTSAYVNITIHNVTARIEGYSGMPAGLTSPTLMPGVIVSLITQEVTLLTFGTIDVRHAVAVMTLVNGSAPSIPFVAQVASLSFSMLAVNARLKVINSTISLSENTLVSHAGVLFATAPALMSLNVLTSLIGLSGNCTNISITVINSDVLLASYSCSALSSMLLNMTGIVSLANMASAAAAAAPALAALQGSQPNEVTSAVLRMINTSVRSMATSGLQATGTDYRGHLILPPTASNITVVVLYPMQASSNTIVCPMTDCNLSTSTIAVSYASGSGLFVSAANTVSIHSSSLNISRSSLVSPTAGQQIAVIGRKNSSSPNALVWGGDGSQVTFGHSNFSGFAQLVGGTPAAWCSNGQPDLLTINCVEWNGGPVPEHSIPSPTSCLVAQRPTQVECPSLEPPIMPSQSASILSVANTATLVRAESLLTIIKPVSTDTSAAMIYTAIVVGGSVLSRGTIPNLQRASSALRLAALCNQAGDDSSSNAADAPLLADLADNPLHLQIHSVGGPSMSYAAGAVVGNAVLVVGIGLVLHAVAMLEMTMK